MTTDPSRLTHEDLFRRIVTYLRLGGLSSSRDSTLEALQLVQEVLADESAAPMDRIMTAVQRRLDNGENTIPPPSPRINRGSIGYPG